jgi:predicted RNA-binding protein
VPSYWTLSGTLENWMVALEKGVWGVSEKARALWAKVQPGDIVAFYAKRAGVIGRACVNKMLLKLNIRIIMEKEGG